MHVRIVQGRIDIHAANEIIIDNFERGGPWRATRMEQERWVMVPQMYIYRVVQQIFTPEIEVFHMLFDRSYSIISVSSDSSLKQHMEYFNFRC